MRTLFWQLVTISLSKRLIIYIPFGLSVRQHRLCHFTRISYFHSSTFSHHQIRTKSSNVSLLPLCSTSIEIFDDTHVDVRTRQSRRWRSGVSSPNFQKPSGCSRVEITIKFRSLQHFSKLKVRSFLSWGVHSALNVSGPKSLSDHF